jgi:chorismate dehydratase
VSYLNAKPLIHGLDAEDLCPIAIELAPPSAMLDLLLKDQVEMALCPVIDLLRSPDPLAFVPCGGIGCAGPTLTVRLYSRSPIEAIQQVHCDTDSHSSVALLQLILHERYGIQPKLEPWSPVTTHAELTNPPEAMLLIGDKVVTDPPEDHHYPYQLDLGQAWQECTGLPFVFAIWLAKPDTQLGQLPQQLIETLDRNLSQLDELVAMYASQHGWPMAQAKRYLGSILRYHVGPRELQGVGRFLIQASRLKSMQRFCSTALKDDFEPPIHPGL